MALTGIHVLCTSVRPLNGASLVSTSRWSETLATAGTTTQSAPSGEQLLVISAAVDAFVAIGSAPDASQATGSTSSSARAFVRSGTDYQAFCTQGDKVAWVAA